MTRAISSVINMKPTSVNYLKKETQKKFLGQLTTGLLKMEGFLIDIIKKILKKKTYKESIESYKQPADYQKYKDSTDLKNEDGTPLNYFEDRVAEVYSPAEKYDLLVGDLDFTLTNTEKSEGDTVQKDPNGDVAGWMGHCHGWTPASYLLPKPVKSVKITAADGKTNITFYPEDIKALATIFWAEAKFTTKFLGSRCNYKDLSSVPKDSATGLWDDYKCFTVNPATLTLAMGNQIGIRQKNLIYDPDSNGQIWNQPVFAYEMNYFNPVSGDSGDYSSSKITMAQVKENSDKQFLNFVGRKAGSKTKYVIGVTMRVKFVFENPPQKGNTQKEDNIDSRLYKYVLELDSDENIVGGEWTENSHPIFIWQPAENETPRGYGDSDVKSFDGSVEQLKKLTKAAKAASQKRSVLSAIVNYFFDKAKGAEDRNETS